MIRAVILSEAKELLWVRSYLMHRRAGSSVAALPQNDRGQ